MLALVEEKKSALQQQMDDIKVVLMELNSAEQQCRFSQKITKRQKPKSQ